MMQFITPLRVQPIATQFDRAQQPVIPPVIFRNQHDFPVQTLRLLMHRRDQCFQKGIGRKIEHGMGGIQPQPVDVKFGDPVQGIFDEEAPHVVAVRPIEIQPCPPRRMIAFGEVRAEVAQVITLWPQMVVDHIQHHGQTVRVTGVHQPLQPRRAAIRVLDGEQVDAIIAPVAHSGELRDRHQLDSRHT